MSMSKDEQKRKRTELTYTKEPLSKRNKQNDNLPSSDGENLLQSMSFSTSEMISNTTNTISPVSIQLDAQETMGQLQQRAMEINNAKFKITEIQMQLIKLLSQMNEFEMREANNNLLYDTTSVLHALIVEELTIQKKIEGIQKQTEFTFFPSILQSNSVTSPPPVRIVQHKTAETNNTLEKVNFNREEYMELYEKFYQLFNKKACYTGTAGTSMTYVEPDAPQLRLYYSTGEMVLNGATIQKVNRQTFCNGKQVIEGRTLVSGKIYFYLEKDPKTDQFMATELIPPHVVPVKTPGSPYSTYKDRQVIQLCLTAVKDTKGKIIRRRSPDYSEHYEFHTKAINVINNTTINFNSRSSFKHQILFPLVTDSLNEEKSNQRSLSLSDIQYTASTLNDFGIFTEANNENSSPLFQERDNESHAVVFPQPQITVNQTIMVQENETPLQLPSFNHLLSSLGIFSSDHNSRSTLLPTEEKQTKEFELNC